MRAYEGSVSLVNAVVDKVRTLSPRSVPRIRPVQLYFITPRMFLPERMSS